MPPGGSCGVSRVDLSARGSSGSSQVRKRLDGFLRVQEAHGGRPMSSFEARACRYGGFTLLGHASSDSRSVTERPFVFPL
jgi:hypothetical protein